MNDKLINCSLDSKAEDQIGTNTGSIEITDKKKSKCLR